MEASLRLPRADRSNSTRHFYLSVAALPFFFFFFQSCHASNQTTILSPGFSTTQILTIDNDGLFLLSPSKAYKFGFQKATPDDATSFLLAVVYNGVPSNKRVVWTANPTAPVQNNDKFVLNNQGHAELRRGDTVVWSPNVSAGATAMVLYDTGNLVLLKTDQILWQSFDHPTDTLLPGQPFTDGMTLSASAADAFKWTYTLQAASGDVSLLAGLASQQQKQNQQPYWSISKDVNKNDAVAGGVAGRVHSATLSNTSWQFFDDKGTKLTELTLANGGNTNASIAVVLDSSGVLNFYDITTAATNPVDRVPKGVCETPGSCDPYTTCSVNGGSSSCGSCPSGLVCTADAQAESLCKPGGSPDPSRFVDLGLVRYNPTKLVSPTAKVADLNACKAECSRNCSCRAAFFDGTYTDCFLFDAVGSLQDAQPPAKGQNSNVYRLLNCSIKTGTLQGGSSPSKNPLPVIVGISVATAVAVAGMIYLGVWCFNRKSRARALSRRGSTMEGLVSSDEDDFLGSISGAPVRYSYADLVEATDNFSRKLGQGGFGSVYLGTLPDGSRVAVKKLEGIGQGRKEFRAEVSIIGSIRHLHLVRLRGFCAEGTHRLLAYEFMANGSLDKWIFRRNSAVRSSGTFASSHASSGPVSGSSNAGSGVFDPQQELLPELDWEKRFSIALGTAKGLAYLHEDCDDKIVHCDIKPENVLLDDHFHSKVSDFGLAKLMTREQSHVFTTMRGTRGYLAPEWITCAPISEKSDVYSYGIVLLELVAGRKNFEPALVSEKAYLPSYAFRMMEEGTINEVFDDGLRRLGDKDERVELAVKVALWCIQEDMAMRPSMSKVVQMLEGVAPVPLPPLSHTMGSRVPASIFKGFSDITATSSSTVPSDCNSDVLLSAVRLSGPR